jgi:short subunit fatty acids transporter
MKTNKMTLPLLIAAASLAFVLSPTVGLPNTPVKSKAHQTQVVRQPVRKTVNFQIPAAKTENHVRSLEQVIQDQRDWYQMID